MNKVMLEINGETKEFGIPGEWNELTEKELRYCISHTGDEYAQVKIFMFLLKSSVSREKKWLGGNWQSRVNKDQAAIAAIDATAYLFEKNTLTKQHFKEIKVYGKKLTGPQDEFKDLTCGQMELVYPLLERFRQSFDAKYLVEMCSYLFKIGKHPVNENTGRKIYPFVERLPQDILMCMYCWFSGCMNQLPVYFTDLYDADGEAGSGSFDFMAFANLIHSGAGPKNGSREDIRRMPLLEFLYVMDMDLKYAKELEKKYAQA